MTVNAELEETEEQLDIIGIALDRANRESQHEMGESFKKWGRPPKYSSPRKLQLAIEDYFKNGVREKKVVVGTGAAKHLESIPVPTISGLVTYIGFADRYSFYQYEQKPDFAYTIKKARAFIEQHYEELLQSGNPTGAIFALKNFGWKDERTENVNSQSTVTHVITADERAERVCSMLDTMQRQREVMDKLLPPVIEAERVD